MVNPFEKLTWSCHVCNDERPDERISVRKKPVVIKGRTIEGVTQNIRYCNDRPACVEASLTFEHVMTDAERLDWWFGGGN